MKELLLLSCRQVEKKPGMALLAVASSARATRDRKVEGVGVGARVRCFDVVRTMILFTSTWINKMIKIDASTFVPRDHDFLCPGILLDDNQLT